MLYAAYALVVLLVCTTTVYRDRTDQNYTNSRGGSSGGGYGAGGGGGYSSGGHK
jgi:uncharacterized membrane protein YgcG